MKHFNLPREKHYRTSGLGMISLPHGKWMLVDRRDFRKVLKYSWSVTGAGYVVGYVEGKLVEASRFLAKPRRKQVVDHRNGNLLDNTRKNLRICTRSQNNANALKKAAATSRFKGVTLLPSGRFRARCIAGSLGSFDTEIEAALAYDHAMRALFGRFACVNIPRKSERCAIPSMNTCSQQEAA